jgi:hypothetical protein
METGTTRKIITIDKNVRTCLLFCLSLLQFTSSHAQDAIFSGNSLNLPVVQVAEQIFQVELSLISGSDPTQFSFINAVELFAVNTSAASTFNGSTLSISNVDENTEDGLDFLLDHPVSYPMLADSQGDIGIPYKIRSLPVSYLIDQNGRIVSIHRSFRLGDEIELKQQIQSLLQ